MALRDFQQHGLTETPDLSNRLLVGRLWDPERAEHGHVIMQFETGRDVFPGTLKGGPILFGTFLARWEGEYLRIDWRCQMEQGLVRGRTYATVERVAGGRIRLNERWIEADEHSRPGFLALEEPMTDVQS